MKRTIKDLDVKGKKILLRLDFNVPMNFETGEITDNTRIMESLATINYLCDNGAKVIICSHLGRPKGKVDSKYSLKPVAEKLSMLVKNKVTFALDTIGKDAKEKISQMQDGEIVVLENLRFDSGEEENSPTFSKALAGLADYYVNDAFGTAHRKHASTYGVAKLLPNAIGFLISKELKIIGQVLSNPNRPLVAVLGGAKISDKIPVIENLLDKADYILIGGGMSYTFIKSQGGKVGKSLVDDSKIELCKKFIDMSKDKKAEIVLPIDNICNTDFDSKEKPVRFLSNQIDDNYMGLDIGPKTIKLFKKYIKRAGTVIWNGPMGVFENPIYARGTNKIAKYVAKTKGFSFIGGGDSASAVVKSGYGKKVDHLSTGGGASLALLEGKTLPGIEIIANAGDPIKEKTVKKVKSSKKTSSLKSSLTKKVDTKQKLASSVKKIDKKVSSKSNKDSKKKEGDSKKNSSTLKTKADNKTKSAVKKESKAR